MHNPARVIRYSDKEFAVLDPYPFLDDYIIGFLFANDGVTGADEYYGYHPYVFFKYRFR